MSTEMISRGNRKKRLSEMRRGDGNWPIGTRPNKILKLSPLRGTKRVASSGLFIVRFEGAERKETREREREREKENKGERKLGSAWHTVDEHLTGTHNVETILFLVMVGVSLPVKNKPNHVVLIQQVRHFLHLFIYYLCSQSRNRFEFKIWIWSKQRINFCLTKWHFNFHNTR